MNASSKKKSSNKEDLLSLHPGGTELTLYAAQAAGLSSGDEVLDVGCGTAAGLSVLREEFGIVPHGIDISPEVIRSALKIFPDMDLRCGSAYDLPYPDGAFDAVISECVLTLLDDPRKALREALRVLREGGVLILSFLAERSEDTGSRSLIENGLIRPSVIREFLEDLGAELLLSEDRRNDLTQYMIESIIEYGSLEDRIRSDTERTGTSVFSCSCRHDPHNTTYCLQIFRKISSCCCTQVQTLP